MEVSPAVPPAEGARPKKRWRRMDQVFDRGIETAPRETATTPTPARQAERKIIQKSHLLKVQRDIFNNQGVGAIRESPLQAIFHFAFLNASGWMALAISSNPSIILGEGRRMMSESMT